MELPSHIKQLYKHWERHTALPKQAKDALAIDRNVVTAIASFINERLKILENKEHGSSRPYTTDPILNTFRFCNIYREFDRQTIHYHTLLKPLEGDFPLWLLNMLFCRSICRTETIDRIGLLSFDENNQKKVFDKLSRLPSPKYGNAYIFPISVIQKSEWNTREKFFCYYYPTVVQKIARTIEAFNNKSVVDALNILLPQFGFNLKFLWTEVLIDVAYQYPDKINLFKQFPIGPGSLPTMKSLCKTEAPETTNLNMIGLIDSQLDLPTYNGQPIHLSAENWEGIGCEFRKYTNLRAGVGRKRLYS